MKFLENVKEIEQDIYKELDRLIDLDKEELIEASDVIIDKEKYHLIILKKTNDLKKEQEIIVNYNIQDHENRQKNLLVQKKVRIDKKTKKVLQEEASVFLNNCCFRKVCITYEDEKKVIDIKDIDDYGEVIKGLERFYNLDTQTLNNIRYNDEVYNKDNNIYTLIDEEGCLFSYDFETNKISVIGRNLNDYDEKSFLNINTAISRLDALQEKLKLVLDLGSDLGVELENEIGLAINNLEKRKKFMLKIRNDIVVVPRFFQPLKGISFEEKELKQFRKSLLEMIDKELDKIIENKIGNVLDNLNDMELQYVLKKKFDKE